MPTGIYKHKNQGIHPKSEFKKRHIPSEKTRRKISETLKGRHLSEDTRKKLSKAIKGKHRSKETKRKISEAKKGKRASIATEFKKGERHPNWKGGITSKNTKLWRSKEYQLWQKAILEKNNYTCQICGDNTRGKLHAHHLWQKSKFPELMFEIRNGITLCKKCHKKIHKKKGRFDKRG